MSFTSFAFQHFCNITLWWLEHVYIRNKLKLEHLCCWISPTALKTLIPFIQGVPLATEPGISLIILTPMKILQRNLNSTCYDVVTFLTQRGKSTGLLRPAWCKLFSVTLLHFPRSTCFGCHIHPSSGASYNAHAASKCKCTCELTRSMPCLAWVGSQTRRRTGQLTRALTCIRLHVHYMTLLRMDVYCIRNM